MVHSSMEREYKERVGIRYGKKERIVSNNIIESARVFLWYFYGGEKVLIELFFVSKRK